MNCRSTAIENNHKYDVSGNGQTKINRLRWSEKRERGRERERERERKKERQRDRDRDRDNLYHVGIN